MYVRKYIEKILNLARFGFKLAFTVIDVFLIDYKTEGMVPLALFFATTAAWRLQLWFFRRLTLGKWWRTARL